MYDFTPNRSLLNPKFEGYKLLLLDQDDAVRRYRLPYKTTQASSYGRTPLTFGEVQSRITHNHLALSARRGRGLYIDRDHRVIVVDVGDATTDPSFTAVYELPAPITTPQVDIVHTEYPSASFLDETIALIGDGRGSLYVLDIPPSAPASLLASFELVDPSADTSTPLPFRVHNAIHTSDTTAVALLSSRYYGDGAPAGPSTQHPTKHHEFDVWAARFALPFDPTPRALDILWRRRGDDVPLLTAYHRARDAYLLLGASSYRPPSTPYTPPYDPVPDELAPIPRAGEALDTPPPPPPHPYAWTQTADDVTLAFPLPSTTAASDIHVAFAAHALTVHAAAPGVPGVAPPRYSARPLWDAIRPASSFWTWDRAGEHAYGILAVHMDKQHEGTKWVQVFAAGDGAPDADVPETLDPSELYAIREALEKYTAALAEGEDASGLRLGRGLPALAQGELDDEVDADVGRPACVTWVGADGSCAPRSGTQSAFSVLSTPLPGTEIAPLSLVVKTGLDGTRHVLVDGSDGEGGARWMHVDTFSALAFVLASKRDTRFAYHAPGMVFAFENGAQDRGGNVYMYRICGRGEQWARQSVLPVGQGDAGSLLGVGAVPSDDGYTIVCLCENELVILRHVR